MLFKMLKIDENAGKVVEAVSYTHLEREGAGMLLVSHTPALTERVATRKVKLSRSES